MISAYLLGILGSQHRTADHGLYIRTFFLQESYSPFHSRQGGGHKRTETNKVCAHPLGLRYDLLRGYVLTEIDNIGAIIFKQELYNILTDIMDITLYGGKDNGDTPLSRGLPQT